VRHKICKEALQALDEQLKILKGLLMEEYMYLTMLNAGVSENNWLLQPIKADHDNRKAKQQRDKEHAQTWFTRAKVAQHAANVERFALGLRVEWEALAFTAEGSPGKKRDLRNDEEDSDEDLQPGSKRLKHRE
jgi:hypothetical protein